MKNKGLNKIGVLAIALTAVVMSSCSSHAVPQSEVSLQDAYHRAIEDARIAEPDEICTNLVAITGYNKDLIWDGEPSRSRVLVVTWTSWEGYNSEVGQSVTGTREVWVTTVPELKNFCAKNHLSGDALTLRLEQLLGLPPSSGKKWLVEIWTNPDDLFRPSPDPEISDHEAELYFRKDVSAEYARWFSSLEEQSYGEKGYPWTRLGYTYDWGNPASEIGLSEFVIRTGAPVTIHSVSSTSDYCQ